MASQEENSEPLKYKTWVLKVFIHCEGCRKKVYKILLNIKGVFNTEIDSKLNKVTVTGDVDAETLIRRLQKSGKHAELWPMPIEKKPSNPNPNPNPNSNPNASPNSNNEKGKKKKQQQQQKDKEPNENAEKKPEKKKESDDKPAETAVKAPPAETCESNSKEASSSKPTTSDAGTGTDTKNGKMKGKKAEPEAAVEDKGKEELPMKSGGMEPIQHGGPMHQFPVYQQPAYATSYNMVHPTASYSYYAPMATAPTQSYNTYPGYPPPQYYPHENYYRTTEQPQPSQYGSQGTYDYFSDENPNSCNLM